MAIKVFRRCAITFLMYSPGKKTELGDESPAAAHYLFNNNECPGCGPLPNEMTVLPEECSLIFPVLFFSCKIDPEM